MKQMILYTGNGISLSPIYEDGRKESSYIRLIAEEDRAITDGSIITVCVDVPKEEAPNWKDCELPADASEPMTETEQKARAYDILTGVRE